jgi:hypothetical protein
MPRRITTAGFFWLRLCPNSLLRLSALNGATFLCFQAKVSTDLKILWILPRGCSRPTSTGGHFSWSRLAGSLDNAPLGTIAGVGTHLRGGGD